MPRLEQNKLPVKLLTCIVDDDIDASVLVDHSLDNSISVLCAGLDAESFSAELLDLLYDWIGIRKIVDDHCRAGLQRVRER